MAQHIKKPIPLTVDQSIINQFLARQGNQKFTRILSDQMEAVSFPAKSSALFWYNNSMLSYEPHRHSAYEMIIPMEGNYLITVEQQIYEVTPGDIFLIPSGRLHSLKAPSRGGRFIFLFDFDPILRLKGFSYLADCLSAPLLINRSTCPAIYAEESAIIAQLCTDYLSSDSMRDVVIFSKLLSFFQIYGKNRLSMEGNYPLLQPTGISSKAHAEKFSIVFSYLDEHFAEDLTLEHMAAVAGFSKYHFSRTFKQQSGYNFYDYLCRRRIKSAEMLLMDPTRSISQIALQSGFSSVSTFNRIFKKLKNCTPTQYRSMFHVHTDSPIQEDDNEE